MVIPDYLKHLIPIYVIMGLIVLIVVLFVGCVDRSGYKECFASYDNLILKNGYKIIDHTSDFACCVENHYMVNYLISHNNSTMWTGVFVYCAEDDRLIWMGNDGAILPDYILKIEE